jgi:hypothetical protein
LKMSITSSLFVALISMDYLLFDWMFLPKVDAPT